MENDLKDPHENPISRYSSLPINGIAFFSNIQIPSCKFKITVDYLYLKKNKIYVNSCKVLLNKSNKINLCILGMYTT